MWRWWGLGLGLGPPGYCLQLASPPYLSGPASLRHGGAGNLQHQTCVHHGLLIPRHTCSLCVCVCVFTASLCSAVPLHLLCNRDFLLQNIFVNAEGFQQRTENETAGRRRSSRYLGPLPQSLWTASGNQRWSHLAPKSPRSS